MGSEMCIRDRYADMADLASEVDMDCATSRAVIPELKSRLFPSGNIKLISTIVFAPR